MMIKETTIMGICGTCVSAIGASISVNELQAIISIIVTVLGFILGVVLPWVIKIVQKVRKAKEDGKITKEEADDIIQTIGEAGKDIKEGAESLTKEVSEKSEGDK